MNFITIFIWRAKYFEIGIAFKFNKSLQKMLAHIGVKMVFRNIEVIGTH
jgi:hypothetical protein